VAARSWAEIFGAVGPQAGTDRGGLVGIGKICAQQCAPEPQPGDLHVRVGGQHGFHQLIQRRIMEPLPPEAGLLMGEAVIRLLPARSQYQILSVIGALLAAGAHASSKGQAERQFG